MRNSEYANIEKAARAQGWKVEHRWGRHIKLTPPDPTKRIVFAASTPSDRKSWRPFLTAMRASGLIYP
jgi:hypothetical protein